MISTLKLQNTNLSFFPNSLTTHDEVEYGLAKIGSEQQLAVLADPGSNILKDFSGVYTDHEELTLVLCPLTARHANSLRCHLPWLKPRPLGLATSAGLGDRLGVATPGHVRAVRAVGGNIAPIFAQQSMREMARTGRTPQIVMDNATWGTFQEGWKNGVGADADHLKTPADIDICLAAGFTFFTIDPGDHVDNRSETTDQNLVAKLAETLPAEVQPGATGLAGQTYKIEDLVIEFDEATLLKASVKYGRAVSHVASMYRHLVKAAGSKPFELEVSVDETEHPTSHAEHLYIASQLKRLGVQWISLAPRYIGRFEKGVDYIGDLAEFENNLAGHAAIAREYGPYKLSLHSGSDKFSIYPAAMRQTQGLVHLKTAGTSYLEALRTIAEVDVDLFKEIYIFAREHYETDRVSYHVSADLSRAPLPEDVVEWPGLLDEFDAREIFHVTFGTVLTWQESKDKKLFYDRFFSVLKSKPDLYADNLQKHFIRHLKPFRSME